MSDFDELVVNGDIVIIVFGQHGSANVLGQLEAVLNFRVRITDEFDLIVVFEPQEFECIPAFVYLHYLRKQNDQMVSLFLLPQMDAKITTLTGIIPHICSKTAILLVILGSMPFALTGFLDSF